MVNENVSMADKQYLAKILYTREQLDGKLVAKKVGVSENTISKWVNDFGWKNLRNRLLVSKDDILSNLYEQLEELNADIKKKPEGKRYADSKQGDTQIKYTASIRNLETELAIADLVAAGIKFIKHLQRVGTLQEVMVYSDYWNSFIQENIKR